MAPAAAAGSASLAGASAPAPVAGVAVQPVPLPLRDKGGAASKRVGHGPGYLYAHDYPENITGQAHLTQPLALYTPKTAGWETKIADRLARWAQLRAAGTGTRGAGEQA